ncbi:MAG: nuclease [Verrucomicrobia bacterium]|nr:nuclease [Verrucomicrobiota bacterium]
MQVAKEGEVVSAKGTGAQGAEPSPTASPDIIEIQVDDREAGQPVLLELQKIPGVNATVQRLNIGDYRLGGRLIVERKTAADFVASIIDGRLFSQASRMARGPADALLVLEGSGRDLASAGMSRPAIQGALITLGLVFHLPVLRSLDAAESARLMLYAWRQLVRQDRDSIDRVGRRPKRRKRAQLLALQGLPSVGPKRAEVLLERFGSVRAVVNASADELMAIPGIAERSVKAMEWVLG